MNDNIYGPLQGTLRPPVRPGRAGGPAAAGSTRGCAASACPQSVPDLAPLDQGGTVAPAPYTTGAGGPSVAVATYDPATGQYATPDGNVFRQTDLVTQNGQRSWKICCPPHDRRREEWLMRRLGVSAVAITVVAVAGLVGSATAAASDRWALNGTFTATSNGEWATNNDVFHDEQSVRSIWTISTQCSYPTECTGTVTSDKGWTAPIYQTGGEWYVKRFIPDWMPCYDGSVAGGLQVFRFHGVTRAATPPIPRPTCSSARTAPPGFPAPAAGGSLYISMPFKLVKQG